MKANDRNGFLRIFHVALLSLSIVALAGCGKDFSRAQFTQLTTNKTEAEVRTAVGEPSWVSESKPLKWVYYRKTFNAKSQNKDDYSVSLTFAPDATGQNKVVDVEFDASSR